MISVIVPVYNSESYIRRCVDSILAQTYSDFELILIDDGSTDNSGRICDEYMQQDSRISVIHQANQGQAAARNRGIERAQGEWIHFVDSDDLIHPQMLELLRDTAIKSGASISAALFVESKNIPDDFFFEKKADYTLWEVNEDVLKAFYYAQHYHYWIVCAKLIRKEIIQTIPFEEGRIFEDNAVVCQWLHAAGKVAIVDAKLYYYYVNDSGTTKKAYSLKRLDWLWALQQQVEFYRRIGYLKMERMMNLILMLETGKAIQRVQSELEEHVVVRRLKYRLIWNLFRYCMRFGIPRRNLWGILEVVFPKTMRYIELAKAVSITMRRQGIKAVLNKVRLYMRKNK